MEPPHEKGFTLLHAKETRRDDSSSLKPAHYIGQRLEILNQTASYINAALLTLRYHKPVGIQPDYYHVSARDTEDGAAAASDDLVTIQLLERTQSHDYRQHRGKQIHSKNVVLEEDSVPIFWMPSESKPLVYVDERSFDVLLKFLRYGERGRPETKAERRQRMSKAFVQKPYRPGRTFADTPEPFVFFADHSHLLLELGTVFSFADVTTGGSVRIECAKCSGFFLNKIAVVEPVKPLTFTYADSEHLRELLSTLKYKAHPSFEGLDRVEVVVLGRRAHLAHAKTFASSAFVGIRVTKFPVRAAPLILGVRDEIGVLQSVPLTSTKVMKEDESYSLGLELEPLELELQTSGVPLVPLTLSGEPMSCLRAHGGPNTALSTNGTTSLCALFEQVSVRRNISDNSFEAYVYHIGSNGTISTRFHSTAFPDQCLTWDAPNKRWSLFACGTGVVGNSAAQMFELQEDIVQNRTYCTRITEFSYDLAKNLIKSIARRCFSIGHMRIETAHFGPRPEAVFPNGTSCVSNSSVDVSMELQDLCNPAAAQNSSVSCDVPLSALPKMTEFAGCDMELRVDLWCPNNPESATLKRLPVFQWEQFGDRMVRTVQCDRPFLYGRKTHYILKMSTENKQGAFFIRFPKEHRYLSAVRDHTETDDFLPHVPDNFDDPSGFFDVKNNTLNLDPLVSDSRYLSENLTAEALAWQETHKKENDKFAPLMLAVSPKNGSVEVCEKPVLRYEFSEAIQLNAAKHLVFLYACPWWLGDIRKLRPKIGDDGRYSDSLEFLELKNEENLKNVWGNLTQKKMVGSELFEDRFEERFVSGCDLEQTVSSAGEGAESHNPLGYMSVEREAGAGIGSTISVSGRTLSIRFLQKLKPFTEYRVLLSRGLVSDLSDNAFVDSEKLFSHFRTGSSETMLPRSWRVRGRQNSMEMRNASSSGAPGGAGGDEVVDPLWRLGEVAFYSSADCAPSTTLSGLAFGSGLNNAALAFDDDLTTFWHDHFTPERDQVYSSLPHAEEIKKKLYDSCVSAIRRLGAAGGGTPIFAAPGGVAPPNGSAQTKIMFNYTAYGYGDDPITEALLERFCDRSDAYLGLFSPTGANVRSFRLRSPDNSTEEFHSAAAPDELSLEFWLLGGWHSVTRMSYSDIGDGVCVNFYNSDLNLPMTRLLAPERSSTGLPTLLGDDRSSEQSASLSSFVSTPDSNVLLTFDQPLKIYSGLVEVSSSSSSSSSTQFLRLEERTGPDSSYGEKLLPEMVCDDHPNNATADYLDSISSFPSIPAKIEHNRLLIKLAAPFFEDSVNYTFRLLPGSIVAHDGSLFSHPAPGLSISFANKSRVSFTPVSNEIYHETSSNEQSSPDVVAFARDPKLVQSWDGNGVVLFKTGTPVSDQCHSSAGAQSMLSQCV